MSADIVSFEIKSGGIALKKIQVYSIEVHLDSVNSSGALIRLIPHSASGFPEMSADALKLDQVIEVSLGYGIKNELVFSGKISSQELLVTHDDGADISIICEDEIQPIHGDSGLVLTYGDNIMEMELVNDASGVTGIIKIQGIKVQAGQTFELKGASEVFDGTHTVRRVIHDVIQGNWFTELHLGAPSPAE